MKDEALALFKLMDELKLIHSDLPLNDLMQLYLKLGQPEKVPELIDELKQRNIPRSSYTYGFLLWSYAELNDMEGGDLLEEAELVFDKAMKRCKGPFAISWERFMVYYLKKLRIDLALKHMEAAVSENWSPYPETIAAVFDYFVLILPSNSEGF
ncbi:hypothetical protein PVK06_044282 [Gossypium arboreum]|uniref:Pentatricopeptide repeat-containing protein n=1 Tax=Gossypium arboreum TaxID=29729 RepID=A0ABR0MQS2_GOSAR|nr:hypothetical protein PVK06_044282 [Gossypium arboreum]